MKLPQPNYTKYSKQNQMENNLENKAKFFAQYYGQKVLSSENTIEEITPYRLHKDIGMGFIIDSCLELTPLSDITNEDAIEVAKHATHLHENDKWDVIKILRSNGVTKVYFKDDWTFDTTKEYYVNMFILYRT